MRLPSCSVCENPYNEEERAPMMLLCGHSFCKECLAHLFDSSSDHTIVCPRCRQGSKVGNSVEALRKNYGMLALIRQASADYLNGDVSGSDEDKSDIISSVFSDRSRGDTPQASPSWRPACSMQNLDVAGHNLRLLQQLGPAPWPGQSVWAGVLSGRGGCRHKVAVKKLDVAEGSNFVWTHTKIEGLRRAAVWCQNVCPLYGVVLKEGKLCIVMEKYVGSVQDAMQQSGGRLTLEQILRYGADIARGVSELHSAGIMCMGLKPSNMLLTKQGRAVVADYGLPEIQKRSRCRKARQQRGDEICSNTHLCSDCLGLAPNYMPPEAWEPTKKSSLNLFWEDLMGPCLESDAWSFGCSLVEMCTGIAPWAGASPEEIRRMVVKAKRQPPEYAGVVGGGIPRELWKMIGDCLQWKPSKRPSFHAMLSIFLRHLKEMPLSPPPSPDNHPSKEQELRNMEPSPPSVLDFAGNSDAALHRLILEADVAGVRDLLDAAVAGRKGDPKLPGTPLTVGTLLESRNEDGQTPIHLAAMRGYSHILELLLTHPEADIDALDKNGDTPIFFAVASGSLECLRALVKHGANVNARLKDGLGPSVAHVCASYGHPDCMQELLNAGADPVALDEDGETPLHRAVAKRHIDCALAILSHGGCRSMGIPNYKGFTPLHMCTAAGSVTLVTRWLELDSAEATKTALAVTSSAGPPLCVAPGLKTSQRLEGRTLVGLFLRAGADPLATDPSRGYTCLHLAALADDPEMIKTMLDGGIDVNMRDARGSTALHVALARGSQRAVSLLLEHNADYNLQDDDGNNSLHVAALTSKCIRENFKWLTLMLCKPDSQPHVKNHSGRTVQDILDVVPREWISEDLLTALDNKGMQLAPAVFSPSDWVMFKRSVEEPKYGWQGASSGSVGFVQSVAENGELTVMFCTGEVRALYSELHKVVPFEQGQHVRVKASVKEPRYGWRSQSHSSVGTVLCIDDDGVLRVGFQGASRGWKADPADMERVEEFKVGDWVRATPSLSKPKHGLGSAVPGSIGVVYSLRADHSLLINFCFQDEPWLCEPEEVEAVQPFQVGERVCVKRSVAEPRFGWCGETHHTVGSISDVSSNGLLRVSVSGRSAAWQADPADMERLEQLVVGDWVRVKASVPSPKYGWEDVTRGSVGVVHMVDEDGDIGIGFCFCVRPFDCSMADVEKVPAFRIGQEIRILPSVSEPRLGWSGENSTTSGKVVSIDMDGTLNVRVIGRSSLWRVSPGDAECLSGFEVGDWVRLKEHSENTPSPEWFGGAVGSGRNGTVGLSQRGSIAVVHSTLENANLELAACFRHGRWTCHSSQVEKVTPLKVGQHVQIKGGIKEPRWGWRGVKQGSRGVVVGVHADGEVRVAFPGAGHVPWKADPADVEVVEVLQVGDWVRVQPELAEPRFGWKSVKRGSVGIVQGILYDVESLSALKGVPHTSFEKQQQNGNMETGCCGSCKNGVDCGDSKQGESSGESESDDWKRGRKRSGVEEGTEGAACESEVRNGGEESSRVPVGSEETSSGEVSKSAGCPKERYLQQDYSCSTATDCREGSWKGSEHSQSSVTQNLEQPHGSSVSSEWPVLVGFCGQQERWVGMPSELQRVDPIRVAQRVKLKEGIVQPRFGWMGHDQGTVGTVASVDGDGQLRIHSPMSTQKAWILDPAEVEVVEDQPLKVGDWVRVRSSVPVPSHQWGEVSHGSIGVVHRIDDEGDLWVAFCFLNRLWVCRSAEMERVEPFRVGQRVRVKLSVVNPRLGWGNETCASRGFVAGVDADGKVRVRFARREGRLWVGDPADLELDLQEGG